MHIGDDSLRTAAALLAVMSTLSGASSDLCDGWSAIVVALMIVLLTVPLAVDIAPSEIRQSQDNIPVNDQYQSEFIV